MLFSPNSMALLSQGDREQAGLAGLSALAQGLMMGGAPSLQPGGMGRGLAEGFGGFAKNYQGSINNSVMQKSAGLQQQMAQTQLAEAQRKAEFAKQWQTMMAPPSAENVQMAMAGGGGPSMANAQRLPQNPLLAGVPAALHPAVADPEKGPALLAQFAMRENDPTKRYKEVNGQLIDLGAQGGPKSVMTVPQQNEPLHKVLNPDGTVKYVPRSQAEGQTAPDEAMIVMGADGKPVFMRGGSAAMQGMVSGMGKKVQDEVQEQLLNTTAQLSQVNRISERFKPEFQQIGTRAGMAWSAIKDKGGMTLDPQDRKALGEFTQYRAEAANFYADRLKAMSGAAVTEHEMKRQSAYLPNPGTGVFDGDSPTELAAKNSRMKEFFQNVTARLHYVSKSGMDIKNVSLDKMPEVIRERGNALEGEFKKRGLEGDQLKVAVRRQLAGEFGLVNE